MSLYLKEELAWAAGFFDGEGCTVFTTQVHGGPPTKRYRCIRMQVGQSEPSTLERFKAAVGLGRVWGPYRASTRPGSKPVWQYRVDSLDDVQALALLLWPYLSEPKREQIETRFEQYRSYVCPSS